MQKDARQPARDPQEIAPRIVACAQAGDPDGMAALYEPDAVLVTPGGLARGTDAIREFWAQTVAGGARFTLDEQQPAIRSGDLALTSVRHADGRTTAEVARRQADGSWLWVIDQPLIAK